MADRAAHEAPQDVAASVLGGQDAVGDEEGDGAGVLGDDLEGDLLLSGARVFAACEFLNGLQGRQEQVGGADVFDALEDRGEAVEAEASVDALLGEVAEDREGPSCRPRRAGTA
ncbi:hypothetical protein KCMC57_up30440 [Kitasatospora sp. CMC57]|uniref:Uncharacterized protein n=1 Tax=Kitasatospora sp. CMC57 TaxID=3231513 RepID=A0AB33JTT6_9ACTN